MQSRNWRFADHYPTHLHDPTFWEWLGRVVATFGYLEHILARAIFAFSGTREYSEEAVQAAYDKWLPKLEKSLADTLDPLIRTYEDDVKADQGSPPESFDKLIQDLRDAAQIRNILCHGVWGAPDFTGATVPFFVRAKDKQLVETPVDVNFLQQTHKAVVDLAVAVVNTVTARELQFPGSSRPGKMIA